MDLKNLDQSWTYCETFSPSTSMMRMIEGVQGQMCRYLTKKRNKGRSDILDVVENVCKLKNGESQHIERPTNTPVRKIPSFTNPYMIHSPSRTSLITQDCEVFSCIHSCSQKSDTCTVTPTSRKPTSCSAFMEYISSTSSLRFNATSLVSLPYGYCNNTFMKIKCVEVFDPRFGRRRLHTNDRINFGTGLRKNSGKNARVSDFSHKYEVKCGNISSEGTNVARNRKRMSEKTMEGNITIDPTVYGRKNKTSYKRRYYSAISEQKKPLNSMLPTGNDSIGAEKTSTSHDSKKQTECLKNSTVKGYLPIEFYSYPVYKNEKLVDEGHHEELSQTEPSVSRNNVKFCLQNLARDDVNNAKELSDGRNNLERRLMSEMLDTVGTIVGFRHSIYKLASSSRNNMGDDSPSESVKILKDFSKLGEISKIVEQSIRDVEDDLLTLQFTKSLISNGNLKMEPAYSSESKPDIIHEKKRSRRALKHASFNLTSSLAQAKAGVDDPSPTAKLDKGILITTPCITFANGLKCIEGDCNTSKYVFQTNILSDCDAAAGCYLWTEHKTNGKLCYDGEGETNKLIGKTGGWTYDPEFISKVVTNNQKLQFRSTIDFITDVCKVAVAEVRIPKPDWNENSEYNCLNGYCCAKCCTCVMQTEAEPPNYDVMPQVSDTNLKFEMETTMARLELHKNLLGKCICFCKCNGDCIPMADRIVQEYSSTSEFLNQAISWYDVDCTDLNLDAIDKDHINERIVQERFILRVKTDCLPIQWKQRLPFTCKLAIKKNEPDDESTIIDPSTMIITTSNNDQVRTYCSTDENSDMDIDDDTTLESVNTVSYTDSNAELYSLEQQGRLVSADTECAKKKQYLLDFNRSQIKLKDFKYLMDFTFWDALDILKREQSQFHQILIDGKAESTDFNIKDISCFDPLEIDLSDLKKETLYIDEESLIIDVKHESFVEIALYLPYVPSSILPWKMESIDAADILMLKYNNKLTNVRQYDCTERIFGLEKKDNKRKAEDPLSIEDILTDVNVVTCNFKRSFDFIRERIMMRNYILEREREIYRVYKRHWNAYVENLNRSKCGQDIFAWGVLPVRAMDLSHQFVPLPAGYKENDINFPYNQQGSVSPHECVGYGIGDIHGRNERFSQFGYLAERTNALEDIYSARGSGNGNGSGTGRQRELNLARRKLMDTDNIFSRGQCSGNLSYGLKEWLPPSYSNLTGPSTRWIYSCMDNVNEGLNCIQDYRSLPIYILLGCPEMNFYKIDQMVRYSRKNSLKPWTILQEDSSIRLSNIWTKSECRTFIEKYLMYPKNFPKISQFLDSKKCSDCVAFYYRFKYRLKLKERLKDLKMRIKGKCDMTRFLKRETHILQALESLFEDCLTDSIREFNEQNKLPFNTISDYLMRSGALDSSSNNYDVTLTHHRDSYPSEDEFQYILDNMIEGYFLPPKFRCLLMKRPLEFPATLSVEDTSTMALRGCFLMDYRRNSVSCPKVDEKMLKAMTVALNTEAFFHLRVKGTKRRGLGKSIINKLKLQEQVEKLGMVDRNQCLTPKSSSISYAKSSSDVENVTNITPSRDTFKDQKSANKRSESQDTEFKGFQRNMNLRRNRKQTFKVASIMETLSKANTAGGSKIASKKNKNSRKADSKISKKRLPSTFSRRRVKSLANIIL